MFNGGSTPGNGTAPQGPRTGPEAVQVQVFVSQIVKALIPYNTPRSKNIRMWLMNYALNESNERVFIFRPPSGWTTVSLTSTPHSPAITINPVRAVELVVAMEAHCPDVSTVTIINEVNQVITLEQVRAMQFHPLPNQNGANPPNPALNPPAVNPPIGAGMPAMQPLVVPQAVGPPANVAPATAPVAITGPPVPAVPFANPGLAMTFPTPPTVSFMPPAVPLPATQQMAIPPAPPLANPLTVPLSGMVTTVPTMVAPSPALVSAPPAVVPDSTATVSDQTVITDSNELMGLDLVGNADVDDKVATLSAAVDAKLVQFESKMTSMLSSILAKLDPSPVVQPSGTFGGSMGGGLEGDPSTPPHQSSFATLLAPQTTCGVVPAVVSAPGIEVVNVAGGDIEVPVLGGVGPSSPSPKLPPMDKIDGEDVDEPTVVRRKRRAPTK